MAPKVRPLLLPKGAGQEIRATRGDGAQSGAEGREARDRGVELQRRRGQVDRGGEPGVHVPEARQARRTVRRGHLR
jgi:hypothetical protein